MLNNTKLMIAAVLTVFSINVYANPIAGTTCGVPDRTGTLTAAEQCAFGLGNPDATDIASYYGDIWVSAGELEDENGTDGYLTATSDIGWGVIPNSGTWGIDASFWTMFDSAVISMHIGEGGGDPDHWAWLIADNDLSGTWSIDFVGCDECSTKGGGLSNIKLWGVRGGSVPEPSIVALLAIGLLGMVVARRKKTV